MPALTPTRLEILAPLSGTLVPLDSVPDQVFAQKMVGDGVSLDPTSGDLLAPVAGTVTQLHRAHHALTITTAQGIEVLLHIGIDTVTLKGAGFTPRVREGEHVEIGQPLITFDVDSVARKARSLLTQILIANVEKVAHFIPANGLVVAGKTVVLTLELASEAPSTAANAASDKVLTGEVISLPNAAGLHARPAAVLAAEAKKFRSDVRLLRGADEANAKSVVALMALDTKQGDAVCVRASGSDADEAICRISALLVAGCGEQPGAAAATMVATTEAPVRASAASADELVGVSASPGLAVGRVAHFRHAAIDIAEKGETSAREHSKLEAARHEARAEIERLKGQLADPVKAQILNAHQELLDDPDLIDLATEGLSQGQSAGFAWRAAFLQYASRLESLDNALLRERGNDIRDVGRRVLALLAGVKQTSIVVPDGSILIAEELTPSDTVSLDPKRILGFCTTTGGATSHVAILARALGIPAICGIDDAVLTLKDGAQVILDGTRGVLQRRPNEADIAEAQARVASQAAQRDQEKAAADAPAITTDGHRIDVAANVRNDQDASKGIANGAEGVGLLRSEFLFDSRESAPDEDEQALAYCAVAQVLGRERPLIVRTLDVGGDKPLSYLPLPHEDNPFLGLRGIRVSLDQPTMFRTQLRAILRTASLAKLHIMFPMISTIDELREAKAILADEIRAMAMDPAAVKVGVMIEVPSAALMAEQFAVEADFFSIGTNDLTQYTLAMDRGHPKLARLADGLNPAVLKMIALTCAGARQHGRWVGVCGGMASDAMAVPLLIGLGVNELSVSVPAIPAIKALIRRLSLADCQRLAEEVVHLSTTSEVRARLASFND